MEATQPLSPEAWRKELLGGWGEEATIVEDEGHQCYEFGRDTGPTMYQPRKDPSEERCQV